MDTILKVLPEIITLGVGLIGAVTTFLITHFKMKKKQADLEIEKIELQKAVIENTLVICPSCKAKFKLKDAVVASEED